MENKSLLTFPCEFPIKILGLNSPDFIAEVCAIVSTYSPTFHPQQNITISHSSKDKYLSVTATIIATSQEQLDAIYLALNKHELVKVTL